MFEPFTAAQLHREALLNYLFVSHAIESCGKGYCQLQFIHCQNARTARTNKPYVLLSPVY